MINKAVSKHYRKFKKISEKLNAKLGNETENGYEYKKLLPDSEIEYHSLMISLTALLETGNNFTVSISGNDFVNRDFQLNQM